MTSTTKEFFTERMRYLLYETNEVFTQKTWDSSDQDDSVTEPIPKKEYNPLRNTTHLVESLKKFLEWVIDYSNLEFCVALHAKEDDANEMDICQSYGRLHYHVILYSVKFPKTMDKIIKKNFTTALEETMNSQNNYRIEMFSTNSSSFRREFLRNTKTLVTHGPSIQQHLKGLNHTSSRNHVDCIWDKCQKTGRYEASRDTIIDRTKILDNVEELEKSASQFKHVIPDIVNFLTQNSYGSFTNSQHSSVLKVSLDLTDAQCCCHDCCFPEKQTPESRNYQFIDEGTVLFEQSFDGIFS